MHEVITFSNSHSSGHLLTQLYNVQESHLAYSKDKKLTHSNDVFLSPTKKGGRTNYYPRTVNIEFSGGYGFLGKYAYHETTSDVDLLAQSYGSVVFQKEPQTQKNEYQQCLDQGSQPGRDMLNVANTKYWTAYNKLIYKPLSLLELLEFQHPEGSNKNFPRMKFEEYQVGERGYKNVQASVDDSFRKSLEALDSIQGVNFLSEIDNAWGGFTNELITDVRDEYFNNGAHSKYCLWTYGLYTHREGPRNISNTISEIRAFVSFAQSSSLFIPLKIPQASLGLLNCGYDPLSMWHRGALQSLLVNSIWGLNCQLDQPARMAAIEDELLRGYSKRTIVNEVALLMKIDTNAFGVVQEVNIMDYYQNGGCIDANDTREKLQFGVNEGSSSKMLSSVVIDASGSSETTFTNNYLQEALSQDSFPNIFKNEPSSLSFNATLKQSTDIRNKLKDYRKAISRAKLPQHLEIIGDKGELIEDISSLIEEYTVGYSDESDSES